MRYIDGKKTPPALAWRIEMKEQKKAFKMEKTWCRFAKADLVWPLEQLKLVTKKRCGKTKGGGGTSPCYFCIFRLASSKERASSGNWTRLSKRKSTNSLMASFTAGVCVFLLAVISLRTMVIFSLPLTIPLAFRCYFRKEMFKKWLVLYSRRLNQPYSDVDLEHVYSLLILKQRLLPLLDVKAHNKRKRDIKRMYKENHKKKKKRRSKRSTREPEGKSDIRVFFWTMQQKNALRFFFLFSSLVPSHFCFWLTHQYILPVRTYSMIKPIYTISW